MSVRRETSLSDLPNSQIAPNLAFLGDPDASAHELLFSFSSPEEKNEFLTTSLSYSAHHSRN
jgi:hypothetical protein